MGLNATKPVIVVSEKARLKQSPQLQRLARKGLRALRAYFGPLYSQKLKVAFHQFHLTGLSEEKPKGKILAFILLLLVAMVTKIADKIGLK